LGDCLRRFYARHHPTVAARPSDTEPSLGARSKTAPAPPHSQIVAVTAFAFADFLTRFRARLAVSRSREASSNGRVTDSGFEKKAMKSSMFMREASAPASVRPSSVLKMGNYFWKGIL